MADLATLQTRLTEAETARHDIATGGGVEFVSRDGRAVRYSRNNLADFDKYIQTLERDIEIATNVAAGKPRRAAIGHYY
ncbi:gpW family head-tail joining protein [Parasphingorhabdus sp.]|uniref:gpW family head-tail joining protein n=1 Tax=Parasphingorhabdus sp. TaxID=2709688 RepID=UPI003A8F9EC3